MQGRFALFFGGGGKEILLVNLSRFEIKLITLKGNMMSVSLGKLTNMNSNGVAFARECQKGERRCLPPPPLVTSCIGRDVGR